MEDFGAVWHRSETGTRDCLANVFSPIFGKARRRSSRNELREPQSVQPVAIELPLHAFALFPSRMQATTRISSGRSPQPRIFLSLPLMTPDLYSLTTHNSRPNIQTSKSTNLHAECHNFHITLLNLKFLILPLYHLKLPTPLNLYKILYSQKTELASCVLVFLASSRLL